MSSSGSYLSGKLKGFMKRVVLGETLPNFPYILKEDESYHHSIYKVIPSAKRDETTSLVLASKNKADSFLARNAAHRLRTCRHPDILKLQDSTETDSQVYMAFKECSPLVAYVATHNLTVADVLFGIHSIINALVFLHDECHLTHGQICMDSIFVEPSGVWKLAGFEYAGNDIYSIANQCSRQSLDLPNYSAAQAYALDGFLLGLFIETLFRDILKESVSKVDQLVLSLKARVPAECPRMRDVLKLGRSSIVTSSRVTYSGLFDTELINVYEFLETFHIKDPEEQALQMRKLCEGVQKRKFSPQFEVRQVLPFIIQWIEIFLSGTNVAPSTTVANPSSSPLQIMLSSQENGLAYLLLQSFFVLMIHLPDTEVISSISTFASSASSYLNLMKGDDRQKKLLPDDTAALADRLMSPMVDRIYASPDAICRLTLLKALPIYIMKINAKTLNDKLYKYILASFSSPNIHIRSAVITVTADIVERLNEKNIQDTLRALSRTQIDAQPDIRYNTVISLAKIGKHLDVNLRSTILIPALTRSLLDPYVAARNAALQSLSATHTLYTDEQIVTLVLPAICKVLLDEQIKGTAIQVIYTLLKRIEFAYNAPLGNNTGTIDGPDSAPSLLLSDNAISLPTIINESRPASPVYEARKWTPTRDENTSDMIIPVTMPMLSLSLDSHNPKSLHPTSRHPGAVRDEPKDGWEDVGGWDIEEDMEKEVPLNRTSQHAKTAMMMSHKKAK